MEITLTVSDELADEVTALGDDGLRELLEGGIRESYANGDVDYENVRDVLETLASLPAPESVIQMRPTPKLQSRISALLEKNRSTGLSTAEEREWRGIELAEHLVRLAKANASKRIQDRTSES